MDNDNLLDKTNQIAAAAKAMVADVEEMLDSMEPAYAGLSPLQADLMKNYDQHMTDSQRELLNSLLEIAETSRSNRSNRSNDGTNHGNAAAKTSQSSAKMNSRRAALKGRFV